MTALSWKQTTSSAPTDRSETSLGVAESLESLRAIRRQTLQILEGFCRTRGARRRNPIHTQRGAAELNKFFHQSHCNRQPGSCLRLVLLAGTSDFRINREPCRQSASNSHLSAASFNLSRRYSCSVGGSTNRNRTVSVLRSAFSIMSTSTTGCQCHSSHPIGSALQAESHIAS
jgi:hypothetical protein